MANKQFTATSIASNIRSLLPFFLNAIFYRINRLILYCFLPVYFILKMSALFRSLFSTTAATDCYRAG